MRVPAVYLPECLPECLWWSDSVGGYGDVLDVASLEDKQPVLWWGGWGRVRVRRRELLSAFFLNQFQRTDCAGICPAQLLGDGLGSSLSIYFVLN